MLGREICERDAAAAEERNRRLRDDFESGKGIRVRQDLLPPLKNLLCDADRTHDARPGEGELFPQPWVTTTKGRQRLDDVLGTGFRIILAGDLAAGTQISRARAMGVKIATIGPRRPAVDFAFADSEGLLSNWMVKRACRGVIVRPDHVVYAAVSTEVDLTESLLRLSEALGAVARRPIIPNFISAVRRHHLCECTFGARGTSLNTSAVGPFRPCRQVTMWALLG